MFFALRIHFLEYCSPHLKTCIRGVDFFQVCLGVAMTVGPKEKPNGDNKVWSSELTKNCVCFRKIEWNGVLWSKAHLSTTFCSIKGLNAYKLQPQKPSKISKKTAETVGNSFTNTFINLPGGESKPCPYELKRSASSFTRWKRLNQK